MSYGAISLLGTTITAPSKPSGGGGGGGIVIPGLPGFDAASVAGPLVDAMMPLIEAKMPAVIASASPAIQAEVTKALPGVVSDIRTQVMLAMAFQTAAILGVGWYFLKGPGAHGGV